LCERYSGHGEQKYDYRKKKFLWQDSSPFLKVTNSEYSAGSGSAGGPWYQISGERE
jgi:hypothetical protein